MQRRDRRRGRHVGVIAIVIGLGLTSCGGGAVDPTPDPGLEAPSNLTYDLASASYMTDAAIAPNTASHDGDAADAWDVTPPLPAGLALGAGGAIEGSPTAAAPMAAYTITAANAAGATDTVVQIEVMWAPHRNLAPKASYSDEDIRHLLERTHFGFNQAHYDAILVQGVPAYVQQMTQLTPDAQVESDAFEFYIVDAANDPLGQFPSLQDLANWWTYMILLNANPFTEVVALHWHDHFACSADVLLNESPRSHFMLAHVNLLRHEGTGNFRDLALAIARDPAMLEFLDGVINDDDEPNENFAREWFELYMLGVDVLYTQADIIEASRAFTGYQRRFNAQTGQNFIAFNDARHDHGSKTVLGVVIPGQPSGDDSSGTQEDDDYEEMTDITLGAIDPATGISASARWIVRSILRRFCYRDPPQNVIDELATMLASDWELKPIFDTLFQSEAFYSDVAKAAIVKTPLEQAAGFIRSTTLVGNPNVLTRRLQLLGNIPTRPPTVDGWPEDTGWLAAQSMIDRANLTEYLIRDAKELQDFLGIDVADILPPGVPTGAEVVDALALRLQVDLTPAERTEMTTYMDTTRSGDGLVTPDPFDVTNPDHVDERVRGLLYILGQHPTYLTR